MLTVRVPVFEDVLLGMHLYANRKKTFSATLNTYVEVER
jgi:hypothetical protein